MWVAISFRTLLTECEQKSIKLYLGLIWVLYEKPVSPTAQRISPEMLQR